MAYMRGENYIYDDGENMHFYCRDLTGSLSNKTFDELVAMRYSEFKPKQLKQIEKRVLNKYYGNFGCDGIAKKHGKPTVMDITMSLVKENKKKEVKKCQKLKREKN